MHAIELRSTIDATSSGVSSAGPDANVRLVSRSPKRAGLDADDGSRCDVAKRDSATSTSFQCDADNRGVKRRYGAHIDLHG